MSATANAGSLGKYYLENDAYGIAANLLYRAVLENRTDASAWSGLIMAFSLMRKEHDAQVTLARYALQEGLPFDKNLITFAMMMFQQSPIALAEWFRSLTKRFGVSSEERDNYAQLADELEQTYHALLVHNEEGLLKLQGMLKLEEFAARSIELDWLAKEPLDNVFKQIQSWLEQDLNAALTAVRLLCMIPDPRSEKMLRRVCRDEDMNGKVVTQALLSLRWLGVRSNVKINKMGEPTVIDLANPQPELTISVPAVYKPALDRMKLWMAKEQGVITADEYESHASTDVAELPAELEEKLKAADIPASMQEVVHTLIRSAYDHYYPFVPTIRETRQWSTAFLLLLKQYVTGVGDKWPFGEPEQDDTAVLHRNWLLSASPDFEESIETAKKMREIAPKLPQV